MAGECGWSGLAYINNPHRAWINGPGAFNTATIAHEMGHAVAIQLGHASRSSYENESVADCLAGAFAKHAQGDGSLEAGVTPRFRFTISFTR